SRKSSRMEYVRYQRFVFGRRVSSLSAATKPARADLSPTLRSPRSPRQRNVTQYSRRESRRFSMSGVPCLSIRAQNSQAAAGPFLRTAASSWRSLGLEISDRVRLRRLICPKEERPCPQ